MLQLIGFVLVGGLAGFVATRALRIEAGLLSTVLIGMGGALVGGLLLRLVLAMLGLFGAFLGALLGAFVLIWLVETFARR